MKIRLELCKHCGGKAYITQWPDTLKPHATWITCKSCGIMTKTFYDKDPYKAKLKAAECWNKTYKGCCEHQVSVIDNPIKERIDIIISGGRKYHTLKTYITYKKFKKK